MSALKKEHFSIKSYYINRFKKIYLPLIIIVSLTVIFTKLIPSINWINLKPETTSVIFGYNNFWQLGANLDYFTRHISSPFMHLWYISILIQFELFFPIIFVALRELSKKCKINISNIIVFLLIIITTITFYMMSITQDKMVVYYNTFARSFSIIFGVFLALMHYKYSNRLLPKIRKYSSLIFGIYLIILILLCIFVSDKSDNYALYMILVTIISTRLIKYSTVKPSEEKSIIIKFLSKISYEVYLVQYPVIFLMKSIGVDNILIIITLTFIISYAIHLLIEKTPKNKLFRTLKIGAISLIILSGNYIVLSQQDYTSEMKELENKLNQNQKIIEEKNKEYINEKPEDENVKTTKKENKKIEKPEDIEKRIEEKINKLPVIGVGDSVLLGAIDELYNKFPNGYFDGKVSRTITKAEEILKSLEAEGKLSDTLILALANNGDYSNRINKGLMEIVGDREVYWIDAVGADDPEFNEKFKEFAKDYPNIHIVEWKIESKDHPEYFYPDGIHLKSEGTKAYAQTIYKAIYNNYLEEYKSKEGGA